MKTLLRNAQTGVYYQGIANWTNDPHEALRLVGNALPWVRVPLPVCNGNPLFPVEVRVVGNTTLIGGSSWPPMLSTDHGASYHCPTTPMPGACGERIGLEVSPDNTISVGAGSAACPGGGMYFSKDQGDTWAVVPNSQPWLPSCTSAADNNIMLMPNGSLLYGPGTFCIKPDWCYGPQSPPNGTFTPCFSGLPMPNSLSKAVINKSRTIVAAIKGGTVGTQGCGVFQSTNNGTSWTAADTGLPFTQGTQTGCNYPNIWDILEDSSGFFYLIGNAGDIYKTTSVP